MPNFGETFYIEDWRFDGKGHKAGLQTHTVKMPGLTLANGTHNVNAAAVVTSLALTNNANENADGKVFTQTTADVGTLPLTGYVSQETNPIIFPTNSINTAFATVENSLFSLIGTDTDDKDANSIFGAKAYADEQIAQIKATYTPEIEDPENPGEMIPDTENQEEKTLNELFAYIKELEARIEVLEGGGE